MATLNLSLKAQINKNNTQSIILVVRHKSSMTAISTGFAIEKEYWDYGRIKPGAKNISNIKRVNNKLNSLLLDAEEVIEQLKKKNRIDRLNAKQIAELIKSNGEMGPTISFNQYLTTHIQGIKTPSTKEKFQTTLRAIERYTKFEVYFQDINKAWLNRFKEWRSKDSAPATVNIDLRNIRTLFNRAIDVDEIVSQELYPFRRFEFVKDTPRNLRLTLDQLKSIMDFRSDSILEMFARDFFMFSFYLIGMNTSDIFDIDQIKEGRIEYLRNKTGKSYSIKLEPEALVLIERFKGKEKFLVFQESYKNSRILTQLVNRGLKRVGKSVGIEGLIMYHARHTWAGLAAKKPIGASKSLIAQALGHGKTTVTDTYFDFDNELVDDLNRKVLELVKS